ncbi:hypothetical protein M514_28445 [Trichuris suis]|uniref:Uncharacterized protein n=1 Tax=Trichuris suis TaxID=68888 RepID=A0A085MQ80_9BILA|nr:hypothetical protein M514_28445 [Trichuris suis]
MPFKLRELMVIMCLDVTGPQVVTIDTSDWHRRRWKLSTNKSGIVQDEKGLQETKEEPRLEEMNTYMHFKAF